MLEVAKIALYLAGGCLLLASILASVWITCVVIAAMVESMREEHRRNRGAD